MEEVADFREYAHRNQDGLTVLAPPFHDALVPRVAGVDQSVERTRVCDYGHAWGSRQSSFSVRVEVFVFPLENLPVTDGRRPVAAGSARYREIASRTSEATLTRRRSAACLRSRSVCGSRKRLVRFIHTYYSYVCLPT